jgi:ribonuclease P protein subunit POP4
VVRHELIGLKVKVEKCTDASIEKVKGNVIDETYNMLKIEGKKRGEKEARERSVPKQNSIFIFTLPNGDNVEVEGELLVGRPEDRIKKKFKRW